MKLKESPDFIYDINVDGKERKLYADWNDYDAICFGVYKGKMLVGQSRSHMSLLGSVNPEMKNNTSVKEILTYPGRLWLNSKIISFWEYPSKTELPKILRSLKKEINKQGYGKISNFYDGKWLIELNDDGKAIPIKDYIGKSSTTRKDINIQHNLSPLKKTSTKYIKGIGSEKEPRGWIKGEPFAKTRSRLYQEKLIRKHIKESLLEEEYLAFVKFVEERQSGKKLNEIHIPTFLNKSIAFIRNLAKEVSIKFDDLLKLFLNKEVYKFFQKIKWSISKLFDIVKDGYKAYKTLVNTISEYISNTKVVKWTEEELRKLDTWLKNHPKTKRIVGVAIAGILLYLWFNMSYIGDFEYDFDLTDIIYALTGTFTVSTLFSGPDGVKLLLLFATGALLGLSFPWPGPGAVKFLIAAVKSLADWSGVKLNPDKGR